MKVAWMVQVIEEPLVLPMILLTSKTCHHFLPKFLYTKTSPALCCLINQAGLELEENVLWWCWRCFQALWTCSSWFHYAYLWLHIIVNVATLFAGIFQCFKSFRYKEYLDVWWWVRWCIRSINRSLLKLTIYTRGRYDISYCLKGGKLRKTQILILLPPLHWSKGKVKEFSKQKIISNILTCKLKKGLGFSIFRRCTATWHCLQFNAFTKKTLETTERIEVYLNPITCSNPKPFSFLKSNRILKYFLVSWVEIKKIKIKKAYIIFY